MGEGLDNVPARDLIHPSGAERGKGVGGKGREPLCPVLGISPGVGVLAMCRRAIASKEGVLASASASRFTAMGLPPDFTRLRFS